MPDVTIVKPSALFLMLRLSCTLFALETVYGLCFVAYEVLHASYSIEQFAHFMWIVQIVKFIATLLILLDMGIKYLSARYYIVDHHMLSEKGLVNNKEEVYELSSLRKVIIEQDWLGKKLDYGSLKLVLGARGYNEEVRLRSVAMPHRIKDTLEAQLGSYTKT